MTTRQHEPAQRELVHQLINWNLIRSRHKQYPAIRRTFPLHRLKKHCESPPYYCHYMSWRLGTWTKEPLFERLEDLLRCAETLPNWKHEIKPFVNSSDFATYWSLVWQLQVAEHLCAVGTNVRWVKTSHGNPGPDLSVDVGSNRWYVECYVPRKSFALLEFNRELLSEIDPALCISYDLCLPFQLPRNSEVNGFLDRILKPFLDPGHLAKAKNDAKKKCPVVLYEDPASSFYIYVEGDDSVAYCPGQIPNSTGDPKFYVEQVFKEAVGAKQYSNDLEKHRPNLLAVNYLLSADFQLAELLPERMQSLTLPPIEPNIDVLAASAVGIDAQLTREKLKVVRADNVEPTSLARIAITPRQDSF